MRRTIRGVNPILAVVTVLSLGFGLVGWLRPTDLPLPVAGNTSGANHDRDGVGLPHNVVTIEPPTGNRAPGSDERDGAGPKPPPQPREPSMAGLSFAIDGVITGIVYDHNGQPAPDVAVSVAPNEQVHVGLPWPPELRDLPSAERSRRLHDALDQVLVTDERGEFETSRLPTGFVYRVHCDRALHWVVAQVGETVQLYRLSEESMLRGVVRTRAGDPVTEYYLWAHHDFAGGGSGGGWHIHDPEGRFEVPAPAAGIFEILVLCVGFAMREPLYVPVGVEGAFVEVIVDPAVTLSGVVRDSDGQAVDNVEIEAVLGEVGPTQRALTVDPRNRPLHGMRLARGSPVSSVQRTDPNGLYRYCNLLPARYRVTARCGLKTVEASVDLSAGPQTLDFVVDRGARLTISVVDRDRVPVTGTLFISTDADRVAHVSGHGPQNMSDVTRLGPNRYRIDHLRRGGIPLSVACHGYLVFQTMANCSSGDAELEIVLQPAAQLAGTVRSADGEPLGRGYRLLALTPGSGIGPTTPITDVIENGAFAFDGLRPGTYELVMTGWIRGEIVHSFGSISVDRDTPAQTLVVESARLRLDIRLAEHGQLPIRIELQSANGTVGMTAYSEGVLDLFFLPAGDVTIRASCVGAMAFATAQLLDTGPTTVHLVFEPVDCLRIVSIPYPLRDVGLQRGDLLVAYDGQAVASESALRAAEAATTEHHRVLLTIERDGVPISIEVAGGLLNLRVEPWVRQ